MHIPAQFSTTNNYSQEEISEVPVMTSVIIENIKENSNMPAEYRIMTFFTILFRLSRLGLTNMFSSFEADNIQRHNSSQESVGQYLAKGTQKIVSVTSRRNK